MPAAMPNVRPSIMSSNWGRLARKTAPRFFATSATIGSTTAKSSSAGIDSDSMPTRDPAANELNCSSKTQRKKNSVTRIDSAPVTRKRPATTGIGASSHMFTS